MPKLQTLLGDGCAVVVGLPENFNLSGALRSAKEIRLATAFAHVSGWKSLKADVEASNSDIFLLTGLECNQTEPAVLRDWLDLHLRKGKAVTAKLASSKPFFHPKVLIVHSPKEQFAIVSSGNLSDGGLQTNCECGVFVDDAPTVAMLCVWFDAQFAIGEPLKEQMIREYEPEYTKAKKPNSSSNTIHNLELLLLDYVSRGLPVRLIPSAVYPDSLIHFQFVVHVVEQFLRGSVIRPALHN